MRHGDFWGNSNNRKNLVKGFFTLGHSPPGVLNVNYYSPASGSIAEEPANSPQQSLPEKHRFARSKTIIATSLDCSVKKQALPGCRIGDRIG